MPINSLRSLNARLLLAILVSIIVALAIGGATIHGLLKKRLLDDIDRSLRADLTFHILICDQGDGIVHIGFDSYQELRRHRDPENPVFAQYRIAQGSRDYYRTPNLDEQDLPVFGFGSSSPVYGDTILANGHPARALGVEFEPINHDDSPTIRMHVVVAKDLTGMFDYLKKLRTLMYQAAAGLTILLLAATSIIIRKSLQPLKKLSQQIGSTPITGSSSQFELAGRPSSTRWSSGSTR